MVTGNSLVMLLQDASKLGKLTWAVQRREAGGWHRGEQDCEMQRLRCTNLF